MTDEKTKTIAAGQPMLDGINEPPVLSFAGEEHEIDAVLDLDAIRPLLCDVFRALKSAKLCDGGPHESRDLIGVSREIAEAVQREWVKWAEGRQQ